MHRHHVFVMLKEPRPGRVKTRLGREIGMVDAAWWFRHQSAAMLRQIEDPRWQTVLAVSPDRAGMASRVWPPRFSRRPQGPGDLGARMERLLRFAPPGPAVIVGADIPDIRRRHIAEAFRLLGRHDAVIGPALDGGYWLIGLKRTAGLPKAFLANVRWSTAHALNDTLAAVGRGRVAFLDCLADVDEARDLNRAAPRP
jgi:rSAM/selenodomain-associated transferase 1